MTTSLQRQALYPPLIQVGPSPNLGIVVVIPCYDEDFLLLSLLALKRCERPRCDVEVIVVINDGEDAAASVKAKNKHTFEQAKRWALSNALPHLGFHIVYKPGLPKKHAGVGLARKIGMDEACFRFAKAGRPNGIIVCFDADSSCEATYFKALENHFEKNLDAQACSIYFEHPLDGIDHDAAVYEAITLYELHLRYYVQAQRWAGIPHAFQTIGSSMAVRCNAYQQQGGMNKRKAGEDFYFLQKFIPLGRFSEITDTKVIPSPRPSHRVPFGTGRAVEGLLQSKKDCLTYHPNSFKDLQVFLKTKLYGEQRPGEILAGLPDSIRAFLESQDFEKNIEEIQANTSSRLAFQKRFYRWYDAFMVMKFVHFARDNFYGDIEVKEAARWLLSAYGPVSQHEANNLDGRQLLGWFRTKRGLCNKVNW